MRSRKHGTLLPSTTRTQCAAANTALSSPPLLELNAQPQQTALSSSSQPELNAQSHQLAFPTPTASPSVTSRQVWPPCDPKAELNAAILVRAEGKSVLEEKL
ncbi:hypothetical protein chiPu_0026412 [Chiloscyllium punctatum]|uniref:Uncharacterized protein n=1 Tax=Chiloscyllium punctatum TaxID=137246 RepID=A0A401TH75_CHIPU|nr:hypothetical protein [Chiloscyllium punctatum]